MIGPDQAAPRDVCGVERVIAAIAGRQDGIVTRRQLLAAGVTRNEIDWRLQAGGLIPLYRGVFAAGHAAVADRGRIRAALLAAGANAAASHTTAAFLHKLLSTLPAVLHVTVPRRPPRQRPGLKIHGVPAMRTTRVEGLRVTTVLQTLEDLGWPDKLTREALARRLIRPEQLPRTSEARPTRSEFEERMERLVKAAGLPAPIAGYPIGGYVADFAWPEQRLVVETDGWATHGYRTAFERDRAKDAELAARGWTVIRVTWDQLVHAPLKVAALIPSALALREDAAFARRA
jgi:very-short-patch-repair endonuclease